MWLLKKALPSREEPDISLSIVNSEASLHLLYTSRVTRILLALFMLGAGLRVKVTLCHSYVALLMRSVVLYLHDVCAVHIRWKSVHGRSKLLVV